MCLNFSLPINILYFDRECFKDYMYIANIQNFFAIFCILPNLPFLLRHRHFLTPLHQPPQLNYKFSLPPHYNQ